MLNSRSSIVVAALAMLAVTACKKKPEPAPAPAPAPAPEPPKVNQDSIDAARRAAEDAARKAAADEAARRAAAADAARLEAEAASARATIAQMVYFDFNKDDIREDAKPTLDAKVGILNANAALRIRVAGHTDDRGSDEYNLALGQRRAASVQRYLVSRGVDASRFETVSFGKERPAAQGEDEAAWAKNRRAEFEIIAGGEKLRMPH
ncbi:MAG TPA: peptidoglycan-associated lipoprotein Pal [Gemmatimonadaceae bacterium]